jgi:hypothetical protein
MLLSPYCRIGLEYLIVRSALLLSRIDRLRPMTLGVTETNEPYATAGTFSDLLSPERTLQKN